MIVYSYLLSTDQAAMRTNIEIDDTLMAVIATWCIEHGIPLLHQDRDYDPIRDHLAIEMVAV